RLEERPSIVGHRFGGSPEDRQELEHRRVHETEVIQGCFEFRHGHGVRVRLEDPGDLADELYEGLVPRTLLVRQLSNVEGLTAVGLHIERELFGEPRLADARLTEDRDEVRSSLRDRAVPDVSNEPGLTVTSDERHLRRP